MGEERKEFDGDIPGINVFGRSNPEAYENALLALHKSGLWYSREGPKDKGREQVDSTMMITIKPGSNLFFHKFIETVPPQNLLAYDFEFLGAKDCLAVQPKYDPSGDTRWEYTYHLTWERYNEGLGNSVDQIKAVIKKLANEPHRRNSQMITWRPEVDLTEVNPACMQRAWFFSVPMPDGSYRLNVNYSFRSRNPMTAAPMNWRGEETFLNWLAEQVQAEMRQKPEQLALPAEKRVRVVPGRIIDISDSYHVSAQDQHLLKKFIANYERSVARGETLEQRAFTREHYYMIFRSMFDTGEVKNVIAEEIQNRYKERIGRNPQFKGELEKDRDIAIGRLDEIDGWMRSFIK